VPRILLFDIDMTLIRTGGAGRKAIDAVFAEMYGVENPTRGISFDGRTDHAIFMEVIALHHAAGGDLDQVYAELTRRYLDRLQTTIGTTGGEVLPGVDALLDELARSSAGVGLATGNLREGARIKLSQYGLWDRFTGGGFGDDTPVRAEVVRRGMGNVAAALELDASPGDCWVIGDTPLDIEAAQLAGMRVLAVATGSYPPDALEAAGADAVMRDLSDTELAAGILLG